MKSEKILYEMDFSEARFVRDSQLKKYVVNNIAILGEKSKNGYRYLRDAMKRAVSLFEGVKVFINHPSSEELKVRRRDVRNLAGKLTNARFDESAVKIRGNFVGLPNDMGKLFVDIAETMPEVAGMSQNASGRFGKDNGEKVCEEITEVFSVDLVASPATNAGVFENVKNDGNENEVMPEIVDELLTKSILMDELVTNYFRDKLLGMYFISGVKRAISERLKMQDDILGKNSSHKKLVKESDSQKHIIDCAGQKVRLTQDCHIIDEVRLTSDVHPTNVHLRDTEIENRPRLLERTRISARLRAD